MGTEQGRVPRNSEGQDDPQRHTRLLMRQWLEALHERGNTRATLDAYRSTVMQWMKWAATSPCEALGRDDVEAFLRRERQHGGDGEPATRRRELAALRSLYTWVEDRGFGSDPTRGVLAPKVRNKNPRPVPNETWAFLWDSRLLDIEARGVLALGFFCGLRRIEMLDLQAASIRASRIENFTRKGGGEHTLDWRTMMSEIRNVDPCLEDLSPDPEDVMLALSDRRGPAIQMRGRTPSALNKALTKWCNQAGVDHFTPHQMRHACATNLVDVGVPLHIVSDLMDHGSIEVTMRYVKTRPSALAEWSSNNRRETRERQWKQPTRLS